MSATADQELNERIIAVSRLIGSFFGSSEPGDAEHPSETEAPLPERGVILLEDQAAADPSLLPSQN